MSVCVIYKYKFETFTEEIDIPTGAVFLHAGVQEGIPVLWFRINEKNGLEKRTFSLIGTGHNFDSSIFKYMATIFQGDHVRHIHERIK